LIERRFREGTQQSAPMVVRAERVIGHRIVVVVPALSEFSIEPHHRFVGPRPVPQETRKAID
jgi:hypothetical protein